MEADATKLNDHGDASCCRLGRQISEASAKMGDESVFGYRRRFRQASNYIYIHGDNEHYKDTVTGDIKVHAGFDARAPSKRSGRRLSDKEPTKNQPDTASSSQEKKHSGTGSERYQHDATLHRQSSSMSRSLRREAAGKSAKAHGTIANDDGTGIDWNEAFQFALESCDYETLNQLSVDFVSMAQSYIKIIIMEQFLPEDKQTIPPARHIGGIAGGRKYLAGGILFKMIHDPKLERGVSRAPGKPHRLPSYLYGYKRPNYELAAKSASHNLHGASHYFEIGFDQLKKRWSKQQREQRERGGGGAGGDNGNNGNSNYTSYNNNSSYNNLDDINSGTLACSDISGLRVPMQVALDYLGYRVLAQPWLKLEGPIYGGNGKEVHTPPFGHPVGDLMAAAAARLHLRKHKVMDADLFCAGDVEAHIGRDSRIYLLDLARTFPCEDSRVSRHLPVVGQPVFYRMLRPELLISIKQDGLLPALSPDAFTGFSRGDPEKLAMERSSTAATKYLLDVIVPEYARHLSTLPSGKAKAFREPVSSELHERGINVRHLGKLRGLLGPINATNKPVRDTLLVEMAARTLKNMLRSWQREQLKEDRYPSAFRIDRVVVGFINYLVGPCAVEDKKNFRHFWSLVEIELRQRFGDVDYRTGSSVSGSNGARLHDASSSTGNYGSLWKAVEPFRGRILKYLCQMQGIQLARKSIAEFNAYLDACERPGRTHVEFRFYQIDLKNIKVLAKPLSILQLSRSQRYLELGLAYLGCGPHSEAAQRGWSSSHSEHQSNTNSWFSPNTMSKWKAQRRKANSLAAAVRLLALSSEMYRILLKSYPKHEEGCRGARLSAVLRSIAGLEAAGKCPAADDRAVKALLAWMPRGKKKTRKYWQSVSDMNKISKTLTSLWSMRSGKLYEVFCGASSIGVLRSLVMLSRQHQRIFPMSSLPKDAEKVVDIAAEAMPSLQALLNGRDGPLAVHKRSLIDDQLTRWINTTDVRTFIIATSDAGWAREIRPMLFNLAIRKGSSACEIARAILMFDRDLATKTVNVLHEAVAGVGHTAPVVRLLLENRADLMERTETRKSALHVAAACGDSACISVLCEFKADVNATDSSHQTPLHVATTHCQTDAVKCLVDLRANPNAEDANLRKPFDLLIEQSEMSVTSSGSVALSDNKDDSTTNARPERKRRSKRSSKKSRSPRKRGGKVLQHTHHRRESLTEISQILKAAALSSESKKAASETTSTSYKHANKEPNVARAASFPATSDEMARRVSLQKLIDMGFPRGCSIRALNGFSWNLQAALESMLEKYAAAATVVPAEKNDTQPSHTSENNINSAEDNDSTHVFPGRESLREMSSSSLPQPDRFSSDSFDAAPRGSLSSIDSYAHRLRGRRPPPTLAPIVDHDFPSLPVSVKGEGGDAEPTRSLSVWSRPAAAVSDSLHGRESKARPHRKKSRDLNVAVNKVGDSEAKQHRNSSGASSGCGNHEAKNEVKVQLLEDHMFIAPWDSVRRWIG